MQRFFLPNIRTFFAIAALSLPGAFAHAQDTPRPDGWTYHPLGPDTRCLSSINDGPNHTQAAALYRNAPTGSKSLFIYMEGGGSCNSAETCNANPAPANTDADGYSVSDFLNTNNNKLDRYLYLRTGTYGGSPKINPFVNMNMAMIPYCTGDAHAGNKTRTWDRNYYFWGNSNFQIAIKYLLAKYPSTTTIWLMGTSAGGVGATVQYSYVRKLAKKLPIPAKVHLIEDSSSGVYDPNSDEAAHNLSTWKAYLPGCEGQGAADPDDVSPPDAALFPDGAEVNSLATQIYYQQPGSPVTQTATGRLSCGRLQDTRKYNRGLDPSARYSFISYEWDSVANPYPQKTIFTYQQFFSDMSGYITEIEGINSAWSRHLYIDNTQFGADGSGPLCGRHVVTNFRIDNSGDLGKIEDLHFNFIDSMLNSPANWNSAAPRITVCPTDSN